MRDKGGKWGRYVATGVVCCRWLSSDLGRQKIGWRVKEERHTIKKGDRIKIYEIKRKKNNINLPIQRVILSYESNKRQYPLKLAYVWE